MNKSYNLLKRLLPKIITGCLFLILLGSPTYNIWAHTFSNGAEVHEFTNSTTIDQSFTTNQGSKWVLTLKDGTTKTYDGDASFSQTIVEAGWTRHDCNDSCTEKYQSGTAYASHEHVEGFCYTKVRCSGGPHGTTGPTGTGCTRCNMSGSYRVYNSNCGTLNASPYPVYSYRNTAYHNDLTLNAGWEDTHYPTYYSNSVKIAPFYGMDGATLQMYVGETPVGVAETINAPINLFIPNLSNAGLT